MAVIEMGVDFGAAQKEAEAAMTPAPAGVYTLQVNSYELGKTKKDKPRITFHVAIINSPNPDLNGKKINYFANLPDKGDLTGVGFLTQFLTAVGRPWKGSSFDPDGVVGLTCNANLKVSEDGRWNEITSFV